MAAVRLKDIAERAGVSVMTVSKVMRDAPDIAVRTKTRIRQMALEMGYTPDGVAQGLRTRATKLFGVMIPALTTPVFVRVVMALEERAHELGHDLILCHSLNDPRKEESIIHRFVSRRVEGIFLTPVYRLDERAAIYDELARRGIPTVILGHKAPFCGQFVNVQTEDVGASSLATRHLLELGHKRIAFFAGPPAAPSSHERFEGYRRALREADQDVDDNLVFQAGATIEQGHAAALQLLQENPGATAVQCVNDLVAIGASNAFLDRGLSIPADISVVGFGNVLVSEYFRVPLTTVRQPKLRLGHAAFDSMLALINSEPVESLRLTTELAVRASSGPVPLTR